LTTQILYNPPGQAGAQLERLPEITSEAVSAALRALEPYLDEMGHLGPIGCREGMSAALGAALQVLFPGVARDATAAYSDRAILPKHRKSR
jgi:hypothetical protein